VGLFTEAVLDTCPGITPGNARFYRLSHDTVHHGVPYAHRVSGGIEEALKKILG